MKRLALITLSTLTLASIGVSAQAVETRTEPNDATRENYIISPDDNSPINVVNPEAGPGDNTDSNFAIEERDATPATEKNTILSPDDSSPINVVNPGATSAGESDYSEIEGSSEAVPEEGMATETNAIISPDDNSPNNTVNPGEM